MLHTDHVYLIAEMACSHEGDPKLARKIIDGAGQAGANAIQFQIWLLKDIMVPHHPDYERVKRIELPHEAWADLAAHVPDRYPEMQIIACVGERSIVDFAESISLDAYKLHSADLSNPYLVKYVAGTGKRIDLSVGASWIAENTEHDAVVVAEQPEAIHLYTRRSTVQLTDSVETLADLVTAQSHVNLLVAPTMEWASTGALKHSRETQSLLEGLPAAPLRAEKVYEDRPALVKVYRLEPGTTSAESS